MTDEKTLKIQKQNDLFRENYGLPFFNNDLPPGKYVLSGGISKLDFQTLNKIRNEVRNFSDFNIDDDPDDIHDTGCFELNGQDILWIIDYYDKDYQFGSDDPSDLTKTRRVLTVLFGYEY